MGKGRNEDSQKSNRRREALFWTIVILLLVAQAILGFDSARRLSVTHDEYWHLPVGLLNLQQRRFGYDVKNPPLTRVWSAIPLTFANARLEHIEPTTDDEVYGAAFLSANPKRYAALFVLGRAMNLFWLFATGMILVVWSRELFGDQAALVTALLWVCCPTVLGHGALVTPDAGLVCFTTATLWAVWRYAHQGSWPWAVAAGVLLGLDLATKFTAVLVVPLIPALWGIARIRNRVPPLTIKTIAAQWAVAGVLALSVLNASYLFEESATRLGNYQFSSRALSAVNKAPRWVKSIPIPLPKAYVQGLDTQRRIMEQKHPAYLDGEWREVGFPEYYLLALAYKLPHPVQALLLLAFWFLIRPVGPRPLRAVVFVLLPATALLIISSLSAMQLGVRYVLPVFPLLLLIAGMPAAAFDWKKRRVTSSLTIAVIVLSPLSLRAHPQHLGYFNEYAGGWRGGREHLLDSNLDWGQNLYELRDYVAKHRIERLKLAYFGTLPPAAFGLIAPPPPSFRPLPGTYAVSVNFVKSRPHFIRLPDGSKRGVRLDEFGYFQFFKPTATIGCSIDIYELSREDVQRYYQSGGRQRHP